MGFHFMLGTAVGIQVGITHSFYPQEAYGVEEMRI